MEIIRSIRVPFSWKLPVSFSPVGLLKVVLIPFIIYIFDLILSLLLEKQAKFLWLTLQDEGRVKKAINSLLVPSFNLHTKLCFDQRLVMAKIFLVVSIQTWQPFCRNSIAEIVILFSDSTFLQINGPTY